MLEALFSQIFPWDPVHLSFFFQSKYIRIFQNKPNSEKCIDIKVHLFKTSYMKNKHEFKNCIILKYIYRFFQNN